MQCSKSFSIEIEEATVCPALLGTTTTPDILEGVAGVEPTGLVYVAPSLTLSPIHLWQYNTSGTFLNTVLLDVGQKDCVWIEYIPSTNHFHLVVFDTFTSFPYVAVTDINGNPLSEFAIPDQQWGPITYESSIGRSFIYSGLSNLLEINGDAIARTIAIGNDTLRVCVANGKIYVPDSSVQNNVAVFNYVTEANVANIATSIGGWVVSVGTKVFGLAVGAPARIIVIDSTTDTVTNTIALDAGFPNANTYQLSYLPETGLLYTFTSMGGYAIDPVTETVLCQFSAISQPHYEFALYGGTGVDTQKAIFVPEVGTDDLRKYG